METMTIAEQKAEVRRAINEFVEFLNEASREYYTKHFPNLTPKVFWVHGGRKYISIVEAETIRERNWTIHCFVDSLTADVYKPATWRAPALNGARFNLLDPESYADLKARWDSCGGYLYKR